MFDLATNWPFLVAGGLAALPALLMMTRIQRLEALSYLDSQTGLRNGRLLGDDFALLSRSRAPIALLLADLDNFRRFNAKSYVDGDRALLTAAQTLQRTLQRLGDRVYRKYASGDEFLALLSPIDFADACPPKPRLAHHQQLYRLRVPLPATLRKVPSLCQPLTNFAQAQALFLQIQRHPSRRRCDRDRPPT
jgi:diguanylate cyclase (GGDEF)-like protein